MFQSFFNGLSGMFSFSRGLDNVSNNVANMNTPGYRGTDTFLRSVNGSDGQGYGASMEGTTTRQTSGEIRQTGNNTDLAITGTGFFVLRNENNELFYTRAGQFQFDENNILIDTATKMEVMGITDGNNLERIDITEQRIIPADPTSEISFSGNLSSTASDHSVTDVTIIDASGESHTLTINFTNPTDTDNTWTVEVLNSDDEVIGTGEIQFALDGSPLADANSFDITTTLAGVDQTITLNFGEPGSFSRTTQFSSSSSSLGANEINGHGVLGVTSVEFNAEGIVQLNYSNGETEEGQTIALASFANEANLDITSGNLYQSKDNMAAEFGQPDNLGLGKIRGGSIELSNIDLTQEFADILIIQRGYQASSRVMSVSNELIEQLYNSTRG